MNQSTEHEARDQAFKASVACTEREGQIWDAAWSAGVNYARKEEEELYEELVTICEKLFKLRGLSLS